MTTGAERPLASRERIEKIFRALLKMIRTKAFTTSDLLYMERFLYEAWMKTHQLAEIARNRKEAS